ncbi:neutral zinc metallopeptidase [Umezawaea tangerina]|uniref:Putative metalloprotease n=1 Tax=Umezawaea tangerina TaxID=84725 RepID=A0A2T0TCK9_9PSEU|nr:neutral zinc metallopeptidase [Umezawaea tangerina]PRY43368.1 putative metalloprotease [Umezawaea tangerina]
MRFLLVAVVSAALLAGCAQSVPGKPSDSPKADPLKVAGLEITTGDSGPKPGAPASGRTAANSDGGAVDQLATSAVADVEAYWEEQFPVAFDAEFTPVRRLVSYDSRGANLRLCGTDTKGLVNAFYCSADDVVAWDRGQLLPSFDAISSVAVLAHEMGHAVQFRLGGGGNAPSIVKEQQADCYAGNYFRWVAEGRSTRFRVSTGTGLNQILATLFAIRDSAGGEFDAKGAHGTAFDRVTAFQFGFAEDPRRCAAIDLAEITRRSTQEAFGAEDRDIGFGQGNLRVDDEAELLNLKATLRAAFPGVQVRWDGGCADTTPASYCSGGVVGIDLAGLAELGTIGDFAAFGSVASRYAVAVQDSMGLPVTGVVAGQRTACLTGLWASTIVRSRGAELAISPGDLDEAVVELLSRDSLIAGDAKGVTIPSGFARVEAFRDGFLTGSADTCTTRYR